MNPVIIVHGGAGDDFDDRVDDFRRGVAAAAQAGRAVLQRGGSAADAVEAAICVMEDDPTFDAGTGSFLNRNGEVEMDAIIMEGDSLRSGAVACIQRVKNPIKVARLVMQRTRHCLFVGAGAEAFARSVGVEEISMEELVAASSTHLLSPEHRNLPDEPHDTVGAIALDAQGNLAVGTSTGGSAGKMPGRVGDSPIIGCGAYADNESGAASATGMGEDLMKIVISKAACDLMGAGMHPQLAAEEMIRKLSERTGGPGGLILMNSRGDVGSAFNTHHMARAWIAEDGVLHVMD